VKIKIAQRLRGETDDVRVDRRTAGDGHQGTPGPSVVLGGTKSPSPNEKYVNTKNRPLSASRDRFANHQSPITHCRSALPFERYKNAGLAPSDLFTPTIADFRSPHLRVKLI